MQHTCDRLICGVGGGMWVGKGKGYNSVTLQMQLWIAKIKISSPVIALLLTDSQPTPLYKGGWVINQLAN